MTEPTHKNRGGEWFTEPTKSQRAKGHAKLDGGEQFVKTSLQTADGAGSGDTGSEHLLDARLANGNQRELRGHKKGVGQDEHGHGDKFEQRKSLHLGVRIAPDRRQLSVGRSQSPVLSSQFSAIDRPQREKCGTTEGRG